VALIGRKMDVVLLSVGAHVSMRRPFKHRTTRCAATRMASSLHSAGGVHRQLRHRPPHHAVDGLQFSIFSFVESL
jgi:hypothetical protein